MQVQTEAHDNYDLVTISGRVDSSNADQLSAALKRLTDARHYKIIVDLSGIEYMSSAGLRALITALRTCEARFGDLFLAHPSERAREVLDLAGMDHRFKIFDTITEAEAAF